MSSATAPSSSTSAGVTSTDEHKTARSPSGLMSLAISLAINLIGPWLVYRTLEPHFPAPSMIPLWASALVPVANLAWSFSKLRTVDVVAVITLSQLSASIVINLLTRDPHAALVGHAFQPMAQGLVFAASVVLGSPLMIPLARQSMCGEDPQKQARFDVTISTVPSARRHMAYVTLGWTAVLTLQTGLQLILVRNLRASSYLLAAHTLSFAVPAALIWASIRYGKSLRARLRSKGLLASE